jgi:hypothetical protein
MLLLPDLMGQRPNRVSWITFGIRRRTLPQVISDHQHKNVVHRYGRCRVYSKRLTTESEYTEKIRQTGNAATL